MDKHRLSLIGSALAAVVLLLGGWFIGVQPQLASAAASDQQRTSIESANADNRAVLQKLEAEYRRLDQSERTLAELRRSVPASPDTAGFTRQVQTAVSTSGVKMTSLTYGAVQAYAPVGETASSSSSTASGTASTPAATPSAAAGAAPTAAATPTAPQPYRNDQITSTTFDVVPVTVAIDAASYAEALDFTRRMQHTDRLFLVDTLSQTVKESGAAAQSWSLTGYVYVVHSAATSSSTTGSAATSAVTPTPTPSPTANG